MKQQIAYFTDVYCPWCYGYHKDLVRFLEAHPEVDLITIPGGLFAGSRVKPIQEHSNLPQVIQAVAETYDVDFSGFQKILDQGSYAMNSDKPSSVIALIKKEVPGPVLLDFLGHLQEAFFKDGKSLEEVASYMAILDILQLRDKFSEADIKAALSNPELAYQEYRKARAQGVESYPTLALAHNGMWYNLKGSSLTAEDLGENYEKIINLPLKSFGCLGC